VIIFNRFLITAALPYANGELHIGHLRSTYIPGDIYTKILKMSGNEAVYISGSDEHGTPIAVSSYKEGKSPKEYVDYYHKLLRNELADAGVNFDCFSRTTNSLHYKLTLEFFKTLLNHGYIFKDKIQEFYCNKDKRPLPDRYVKGTCPYCGAKDQYSDYCEQCSHVFSSLEIKDPKCVICGDVPTIVESDHYFFDLKAFEPRLKKWLTSDEVKIQSDAKNYVMNWLKEGLRNWDITRDIDWGVPIPGEKYKVLYVWFDAPIHYISATQQWAKENNKDWEEYWKNPKTKIVHFIGKDIIYHHCLFWPAMLMGMEDYNLPYAISIRGFATLEKQKMSKSRKWYIGLRKFIDNFPSDYIRFYWTYTTPQTIEDGDFSITDFTKDINKVLIGNISNFANRTLTLVNKFYKGVIPQPGEFEKNEIEVLKKEKDMPKKLREVGESIELKDGLESILEVGWMGNKYLSEKEPWRTYRTNPEETQTTLYVASELNRGLSLALAPYVPIFAQQLWNMLGFEDRVLDHSIDEIEEMIRPHHKIKQARPILTPINEEKLKNIIGC
jgi:methionyl-tRNA synthetase